MSQIIFSNLHNCDRSEFYNIIKKNNNIITDIIDYFIKQNNNEKISICFDYIIYTYNIENFEKILIKYIGLIDMIIEYCYDSYNYDKIICSMRNKNNPLTNFDYEQLESSKIPI